MSQGVDTMAGHNIIKARRTSLARKSSLNAKFTSSSAFPRRSVLSSSSSASARLLSL